MKLSIHQTLRGRPVKISGPDGRPIMTYAGQKINLGYGWINIEDDWPNVFDAITRDGFATSAELATDHRDDDNFVSRQLIMVDIDSGMTIEELFEDNFYNNYGAGFYTTPSHTDNAHRFRIMFRTETAILDREVMKRLNRSLLRIYSAADIACKDSTRIFFGTIQAPLREYRENVLPDTVVAELLMMEDLFQQQAVTQEPVTYSPLSNQKRQLILDRLRDLTFVKGEYPIWRNVGWGLKSDGFTLDDFVYATVSAKNNKTRHDAEEVWRDGRNLADGCTLGTVIHLLKSRLGEDCLQINQIQKVGNLADQLREKFLKGK